MRRSRTCPNLRCHCCQFAQLAGATIACGVAVLVPSAIECHCCYSLVQRTSERRHSGGRVNTLGEVIDGDWYVNRHANHRMTTAELQRGHGNDHPPLASAPWQVLIVKPFGVNPGLLIADAKNDLYIMRFDLRDHEGLATGAQMVTSQFFYALGYHVGENYIVRFDRSRLVAHSQAETDRRIDAEIL